jgi:hypothetical protein
MDNNEKLGFLKLARKSFAVLTAAFSALFNNQTKALPAVLYNEVGNKNLNYENFQKRILKPKLVLKLNIDKPENNLLVMHTSHSSHSSHSSHASYTPSPGHSSHSSHSSHISSSPSYTPSSTSSNPTDESTPSHSSGKIPAYKPTTPTKTIPTTTNSGKTTHRYYPLGSRTINKGFEGTDVEETQRLLLNLGYDVVVTGYFGDKTEQALKKFQNENELKPDGKLGNQTLIILQRK